MMMPKGKKRSAAQIGAYYKARTRDYYRDRGWTVVDLEIMRRIHRTGKEPIFVKQDQVGSDLLLMKDDTLVFTQVKAGESWRSNVSEARREFARHKVPSFAQQWIVGWTPRARHPEIVDCSEEPCSALSRISNETTVF